MTCEHVREQLLVLPVDELDTLEPHLSECDACAALAARVRADQADVVAELERFAHAGDFDAAWAATSTPARRPSMYGWLVGLAAAATIALAATPTLVGDDPAPAASGCADLTALEPLALGGALTPEQVGCLEGHDDAIDASRLLMVHLWTAGELAAWEERARLHLDTLDDADADLAYKVAVHLSKADPADPDGVLRYADLALDHREVWTGETWTKRVDGLYRVRAAAALGAYQATGEIAWRDRAKALGREWLEFQTAAGLDTTSADKVCQAVEGC